MKTSRIAFLITLVSFVLLFYKQTNGLNVTLFGFTTAILLIATKPKQFTSYLSRLVLASFVAVALAFGIHGSAWSQTITLIAFILLFGVQNTPSLRSIHYVLIASISNYFLSWSGMFNAFKPGSRTRRYFPKTRMIFRLIFLPLIIVLLFTGLYSASSKQFASIFGDVFSSLSSTILNLFELVNPVLFGVIIIGAFFSVVMTIHKSSEWIAESESTESDSYIRKKRESKGFRNLDLTYEYRSAIILFITLNLLLSILLVLEVQHVWLNFEWNGEFLKSSVHNGIYILIFCILLSIAVTAYFFRGNLNDYPKKKLLVGLVTGWIALNAILVLSVFIRNWHYIEHFALAYKRIGVLFFLALCLVGLLTILIKVYQRKSFFYLIRVNALAVFITLVVSAFFNWDRIIARYNISESESAFVHLDYLLELDNTALPLLWLDDEAMAKIEENQLDTIPFAQRGYFKKVDYKETLRKRIHRFLDDFESKDWRSRTVAEIRAYHDLQQMGF